MTQKTTKPKVLFMGTSEFGRIILEKLLKTDYKPVAVITVPDKPVGRKKVLTFSPVKILAKKYNLPVYQPEKLLDIKEKIQKINPDLVIVAAYGKLISKQILEIPEHGCLNIHPSLLPKYRGASPIQYTILNGEEETGITIIQVTEKIDQGPIISSLKYKIGNSQIIQKELEKELADFAADLLIKTIPRWIKGEIKPEPQDESKKTYAGIIKKESGRIDWSKKAEEIERKVRAFNPWPSVFCKANDKTLKIWKASVSEQTETGPKGKPGKVYLATNDRIAVQCGKDYLIIEELQFSGKKRIKTEDFLKGNIDFIGTILK